MIFIEITYNFDVLNGILFRQVWKVMSFNPKRHNARIKAMRTILSYKYRTQVSWSKNYLWKMSLGNFPQEAPSSLKTKKFHFHESEFSRKFRMVRANVLENTWEYRANKFSTKHHESQFSGKYRESKCSKKYHDSEFSRKFHESEFSRSGLLTRMHANFRRLLFVGLREPSSKLHKTMTTNWNDGICHLNICLQSGSKVETDNVILFLFHLFQSPVLIFIHTRTHNQMHSKHGLKNLTKYP